MNRAELIGRLGADPLIRYMPDGSPVVNIRIATDESYKDKSGEKIKRTEWHNVVLFGKGAENAANFMSKGRLIFVEGKLRTRSWEGQDSVKRYTTEIVAFKFLLLDSKEGTRKAQEPEKPEAEHFDPLPWSETNANDFPEDDVPF
jgi:single-strand DNA-binding protein